MATIPKSTTKLSEGDFCWIKREDNLNVPFVFICKQGTSRSYFYGGLLDITTTNNNFETLTKNIKFYEFALLHIECFKLNNTPIVGNIFANIEKDNFVEMKLKTNDLSIGAKSNVWGYKTIFKYANQIKK